MLMRDRENDTICALSTPPGRGGVSVIRVSGPRAVEYVGRLCRFFPENPESHRVYFGYLRDPKSVEASAVVDEVLVTYFKAGRSFTGQSVVEIATHGNPVIVGQVLELLISLGARAAEKGEFTYRAFMSGRIDLVQAESVLATIESHSKSSARIAVKQLSGELSKVLRDYEDSLTWILAHCEATIDFSEQGIEFIASQQLLPRLAKVEESMLALHKSFEVGRQIREGIEVAIIGRPNVGKSSLLNCLVKEDRAIVSDIPGTTRDTIDAVTLVDGIEVRFVDTAGLRDTDDAIERLGIERSRKALERADYVLCVVDLSQPNVDLSEFRVLADERFILVGNKADQELPQFRVLEWANQLGWLGARVFKVSAKTGAGVESLRHEFSQGLLESDFESSVIITHARHFELLQRALKCVGAAKSLINKDSSPEIISFELMDALYAIQEMQGKRFDDDVMNRVFKEFCIGK